jgi:four helix bundle protein
MVEQPKIYDLEERTAIFAEHIRDYCFKLPKNIANNQYIPQLIRSGSSPGANYIEANENLGTKDFKMKIKICRKEAKESSYWLRLIIVGDDVCLETDRMKLRQEAKELVSIFSTIIKNSP